MVLKSNNYRDGLGSLKTFGVTAVNLAYPGYGYQNTHFTGGMRNISAGEAMDQYVAIPNGHTHPSAWMLPNKAGNISTYGFVSGEGEVSASILAVKLAESSLTGSGDLTAVGGLIVQLIAAILGVGEISDADMKAFLQATADLSGSGGADGTITAFAELIAEIEGIGGVDAILTALGELSADIVVTGTGLTTGNVGQAVWQEILEAGYSAEDIMRIMASVLAGTVSGAETSTVTFKGIDGATSRVISDTDANGNRLSVTLDGS